MIALNADEGWSRDVSEAIAAEVRDVAEHEGRDWARWANATINGARVFKAVAHSNSQTSMRSKITLEAISSRLSRSGPRRRLFD